jgi:hypothetical protein
LNLPGNDTGANDSRIFELSSCGRWGDSEYAVADSQQEALLEFGGLTLLTVLYRKRKRSATLQNVTGGSDWRLIIWRRKLTALKNDMRFGLESV